MTLREIDDDFGGKSRRAEKKGYEMDKVDNSNGTGKNLGDGVLDMSEPDADAAAKRILSADVGDGSSVPETGNDSDSTSETDGYEKAPDTVKEKTSLDLLIDVEKMVQDHKDSHDPRIIAIIQNYENAKRSMNNQLSDVAKQALKQAGIRLDINNDSKSTDETPGDRINDNGEVTARTLEDEYKPPKDADAANEILTNPTRQEMVANVGEVVENRNVLGTDQQEALDAELGTFKNTLENILLELKLYDLEGNRNNDGGDNNTENSSTTGVVRPDEWMEDEQNGNMNKKAD